MADDTGINELAGSPRESFSESAGSSAERQFLIKMSERLTFAQEVGRTNYPHFPDCRVVAMDLQPWMDGDSLPEGVIIDPEISSNDYGDQLCLITVKYGPDFRNKAWPFDKPALRPGTELRYQVRGSAKFLLVPCSGTKWQDNPDIPVPEDSHTAILIPMASIMLQWDLVDNPPMGLLGSLVGKVNAGSFLGNAPETVLFEDFDVSETFRDSPLDMHTNRVNLRFTVRAIPTGGGTAGWNHEYREHPAGWVKMLLSDGQLRYQTDEFTTIFL